MENTYCCTCPPISIDGMIYLSTPEFQMKWMVVAAIKTMFSDEIRKQSIRWTKWSPPSSHLFNLKKENGAFSGTNSSLSRPVRHFLLYAIYTTSVLRKVMLRIQFVCVLSAAVWIE